MPGADRGRWSPRLSGPAGMVLAAPLVLLLIGFFAWPLIGLIADSLVEGGDPYLRMLADPIAMRALGRTMWSSLIVTLLAVVLGGATAWCLRTTNSVVLKTAIWILVLSPMWMGVVIKNYAFTIILGRSGVVDWIVSGLAPEGGGFTIMYTQSAVVLGMLYSMLPYAILPMFVAFSSFDTTLLTAAENLGASRSAALRTVLLPNALPGISATAIIVFVISVGFYVTPVILGGVNAQYLPTLIDNYLFKYYDELSARVLAVVLLAIAVAVVGIAMRVLGVSRLQKGIS